jgi:hypothetical protein
MAGRISFDSQANLSDNFYLHGSGLDVNFKMTIIVMSE